MEKALDVLEGELVKLAQEEKKRKLSDAEKMRMKELEEIFNIHHGV